MNEPLAFIIIFHCIWHSCLLHGKDGICRGDNQILASSRAVTKKRPWDVSVGPAGYPVLHRVTRRGSEEETRNHHPASHWGEHGTIAAWHRRFYTNLEPEPSGMLTGSVWTASIVVVSTSILWSSSWFTSLLVVQDSTSVTMGTSVVFCGGLMLKFSPHAAGEIQCDKVTKVVENGHIWKPF